MKTAVALGLFIFLEALVSLSFSQSTSTTQFSNELRFARPLAKRWSGELNFTNLWMQSPPADGLFDQYSQWSIGGWGHNYIAKKLRLSLGLFYYHKIESEDPAQSKSNELRISGQTIYYIKKIGYTITWRSRLEWRHLQNSEGSYYNMLRLREQVKLVVPITAKSIRQGVFYGFTSEEIFLKTPSDDGGEQIFDRNRFEIGGGYAITNDLNVELYYANEFLPRKTNQINSIINLDFNFRNLLSNLRKKFFAPPPVVPDE